ncbi:NACHT domain-containing protein [Streptomyces sp. NPDC048644]|uniref:NACHT domain-containing protein n=1 Tax=Streptomyces sp. NPDC048644 TaxID=3365582 RepID=UPI00371DD640
MGGSRTRRMSFIYLLTQAAAIVVALWLSKQFHVARVSATTVALVPTVPGGWLAWLSYRKDREEAALDVQPKADVLAATVLAAETDQRAQLIGEGGHRIDVRFVYRGEPTNNASGAEPEGSLSGVVAYYGRLRPARLVITGNPGAGKTLLAVELMIGLLADPSRPAVAPVPVRASLAGWDTTRPLIAWLAEQVHDQLRGTGVSLDDARRLLERHRVLPVLDGLDEMDLDTTPLANRRAPRALAQLNRYQDAHGNAPVILTCRTAQYAELASADVRMREAARIEIAPVSSAQATGYLAARITNPARWRPVLDALVTDPGGPLAEALETPWRLNLAVTVYEERDPETYLFRSDPAELLGFSAPSAVRDHLLAAYLPAAVRHHPTRPGRYAPEDVHHWLAEIAVHLADPDGRHRTPSGEPSRPAGPRSDVVLHQMWPLAGVGRVRAVSLLISAAALAVAAFLWGPWYVLLVLAVCGLPLPLVPPRILQLHQLRSHDYRRPQLQLLVSGLLLGVVGGFTVGVERGPAFGLRAGVVLGLAIGIASTLPYVVPDLFPHLGSVDLVAAPTDPRTPIRDDLTLLCCVRVTGAVLLGVVSGLIWGGALGCAVGIYAGWLGTRRSAGRRYLTFVLCGRGKVPWRPGAFLHWAYGAGLLRVSGIAYQFRHRELQDWLTAHPARR